MKYLMLPMSILILFISCKNEQRKINDTGNVKTYNVANNDNKDSLFYKRAFLYDSLISSIDSNNLSHLQFDFGVPMGWASYDSFDSAVHLYYDRDSVVRFINQSDINYFYFDKQGQLFASRYQLDDKTITTVFDTPMFVYNGHFKEIKVMVTDSSAIMPSRFDVFKTVSDIMPFCKHLTYKNFSDNNKGWLITLGDHWIDLKVYPEKSSKTIKRLKPQSELYYIEPGNQQDTIDNVVWIWYKVKTKNGDIGWIFGPPCYVDILDDENSSD